MDMSLEQNFLKAVSHSKTLPKRPSNDELLKLYALYKQSTEGNNNETRPSGFDFKAIAKYDAWESLGGKSKEEAKTEYILLIEELTKKYS